MESVRLANGSNVSSRGAYPVFNVSDIQDAIRVHFFELYVRERVRERVRLRIQQFHYTRRFQVPELEYVRNIYLTKSGVFVSILHDRMDV